MSTNEAQLLKASDMLKPAFSMQASSLHIGLDNADAYLSMHQGNIPLRHWLGLPIGEGLSPHQAMERAAVMAQNYCENGVDRTQAAQLLSALESSRKNLGLTMLGKAVGDLELRTSPKMPPPAKAFADVVTRACRVLADICDEGVVPAVEAQSSGQRLSTRQAVQLINS